MIRAILHILLTLGFGATLVAQASPISTSASSLKKYDSSLGFASPENTVSTTDRLHAEALSTHKPTHSGGGGVLLAQAPASGATSESILELKKKYLKSNGRKSVADEDLPLDAPTLPTSASETPALKAINGGAGSPFPSLPMPPKASDIAGGLSGPRADDEPGRKQDQNQISITNTRNPRRGVNIKAEVPSVRHVSMSPASKKFGGDDVEIVISPIYDVLIQMPEPVEYFKTSSTKLTAETVNSNPQLITLKLQPVQTAIPISLHLVDVAQNIYTFTIVGVPADLSWEYPKTIIVTKRTSHKTQLGAKNPNSIVDAMDVDDAIQIVVGDKPNTDEYDIEFVSGRFMHYEGYAQYAFKIDRKDKGNFERASDGRPNLKFTIWANNRRLDGGTKYAASKEIEWAIEPLLSKRDSRRKGQEVLRVFVQIRASILDLEEWSTAFITISDRASYTRFDFQPLIREFRAPPRSAEEKEQ